MLASGSVAATAITSVVFSAIETVAVSPPPFEMIIGGWFVGRPGRCLVVKNQFLQACQRVGAVWSRDANVKVDPFFAVTGAIHYELDMDIDRNA